MTEENNGTFLQEFPVRYDVSKCESDRVTAPIVYDHGDKESTKLLYGPRVRGTHFGLG